MDMPEFGSSDAAALGGKARAEAMSDEERRASARQAAMARWERAGKGKIPRATHVGLLRFGDLEIPCAVLDNGERVLSQTSVSSVLGVSRGGKQYKIRSATNGVPLPTFLSAAALKPFVDEDLALVLSVPYKYIIPNSGGIVGHGLKAELIPKVCDVWLKARQADALRRTQLSIAAKAEIIMRGLAHVGIIALVDEATGYQDDRDRRALAKILEAFVQKELRAWVHTFPADYYREMYRLRGLSFPPKGNRMPQYFGVLTNDVVYARLAPGVLDELRRVTPRREDGRLKNHLHRRLTSDVGHPRLLQHLGAVVALMKVSDDGDWSGFMKMLDKHYPRQVAAPLFDPPDAVTVAPSPA